MKQYLEAGKIVNTHGVAGCVRIESWCDSPEVLASLKKLYIYGRDGLLRTLETERASVHKKAALVKIKGVDSLEQALMLKNAVVHADRADLPLPRGAYFIDDLLGLPVIDHADGAVYGVLSDVIKGGGGELYEVKKPDGKTSLLPANPAFIKKIDLQSGIYIAAIDGLFD